MARRFIVSTTNLSKSTQDKMRYYFDDIRAEWWHWLPNTWLIVTSFDVPGIDISNQLANIIRKGDFFVMNITGSGDFSGRFSDEEADQIRNWLTTNWIEKLTR